jgi:hypothetical protein
MARASERLGEFFSVVEEIMGALSSVLEESPTMIFQSNW